MRPITTYYKVPSPFLKGRVRSPSKKTSGSDIPISTLSTPPKSPFYDFAPDQSRHDNQRDDKIVWFTTTSAVAQLDMSMGRKVIGDATQRISAGGDSSNDIRVMSDQHLTRHGLALVTGSIGTASSPVESHAASLSQRTHCMMTPSAALDTPAGNIVRGGVMPPASTLASTRENPLYEDEGNLVPHSPLSTAMRPFGFRVEQQGSPSLKHRLASSKMLTPDAPWIPSGALGQKLPVLEATSCSDPPSRDML